MGQQAGDTVRRPPGAHLRVVPVGGERDAYLALLRLADDSPEQVRGYYQTGTLYGLVESAGPPIGVALAVPHPEAAGALTGDAVELKAVAVDESWHGRGVGTHLLREVLARLRADGVRRVVVGTASCGIGALAFYQKAGFRLGWIERDFFGPHRGYPAGIEEHGIPLRDMVWLDQQLDG